MSRSDQGGKLYRRRRGCLKLWKGKIALVGIRRQGSFGKIWGNLEKIDAPWPLRYESRAMSRYIAQMSQVPRLLRRCGTPPDTKSRELPITGFCAVCGYQLKGWRLILCRKRIIQTYHARTHKVFR